MIDKIEIKTIKVVTIGGKDYPIIHEIPILWRGWELDEICYIIEYDDENRLVWSDHGEYKLISNMSPNINLALERSDISKLSNRVKTYKAAIDNTEQGIKLLIE